ncbi:CLUMA_CG002715, isoform A [Clunio marinus]|uniref:CLUMA_CG002715, isoform A n=1 Tax=Clunio marinus TaxID=568069 RepID=A0A1J1HKZ8_9DIPT|nr:CLUMA_CG002715, isoform A [Clunio marinus]
MKQQKTINSTVLRTLYDGHMNEKVIQFEKGEKKKNFYELFMTIKNKPKACLKLSGCEKKFISSSHLGIHKKEEEKNFKSIDEKEEKNISHIFTSIDQQRHYWDFMKLKINVS